VTEDVSTPVEDSQSEGPADDLEAEEAMEGEYFADEDPDAQPPLPEEIPETGSQVEGLTTEEVTFLGSQCPEEEEGDEEQLREGTNVVYSSEKEPQSEEVSRAASELPKDDRLDAIRPVRIPKTRKLGAHVPRGRQRPKDNTEPFVRPEYFGKKPLPQKLGTMGMKRELAGTPPGLGNIDGKRQRF